jgi:hypothetical protein
VEVGEPPAGDRDLLLLPTLAWVRTFVIAAEEQDQAVTVSVAEHPQQDALGMRFVARWLSKRAQNLACIVAQAKLEQAIAQLLAVTAATHRDSFGLQDFAESYSDRATLSRRQLLAQPSQNGLITRLVRVKLELEAPHHGDDTSRAGSIGSPRASRRGQCASSANPDHCSARRFLQSSRPASSLDAGVVGSVDELLDRLARVVQQVRDRGGDQEADWEVEPGGCRVEFGEELVREPVTGDSRLSAP